MMNDRQAGFWSLSSGGGHGSAVHLHDTDGRGGRERHGKRTRPARSSRRMVGEHVRILAVDDDPQALRYVRDTLASAGYTPVVTGDPAEVLRLVAEEKPDLVLLDLMLPGTDGIELMKTVPELSDVPVIFLSAYGRDQIIARALEAGAVDYIVKPFSPTGSWRESTQP